MTVARLMAGVALVGLMASPALAQNQDQTKPPQQQEQQQTSTGDAKQHVAQEDMDFAKKAGGDGMAEVKLGQLAQQQAKSEEVKQFGQRMVDDHSKANDQLKSIAQQKSIDLPQKMPDAAQQAYDDLQKKSGQEFDQAYMDMMVEDHHKAIDLFQQEAKGGKDTDLQKFAEETLPTLQQHLDLAQKTQEQVTAANDTSSGGGAAPAAGAAATAAGGAAAVTAGQTQDMGAGATPPEGLKTTDQPMKDQAAAGAAPAQPDKMQQEAATGSTDKSQSMAAAPSDTQKPPAAEPAKPEQQAAAEPTGQEVKAQDVIGTKIVNDKGDKVGEIEDLVIDQDKVQYAVVSVGGFLGIGEKHVVVPFEELKLGKDQTYLMSGKTEDQLKQMPEYKEDKYQKQG